MNNTFSQLDSRLNIASVIEKTDLLELIVFLQSKFALCPVCSHRTTKRHSA